MALSVDLFWSFRSPYHALSGHWGVPTFAFDGEPFFGQDRFDLLVWPLRQHGLAPRPH